MIQKFIKRNFEVHPVRQTIRLKDAVLPGGRVCAIIVTYNRLKYLKICLEMVRKQTRPVDKILVINNSSSDGTAEWLQTQGDLQVLLQPNVGNAGGQAAGIAWALGEGFDWMWCMDDDVGPIPTALETQLKASEGKRVVITKRFTVRDPGDTRFCPFTGEPGKMHLLCQHTGRFIHWSVEEGGEVFTTNCGHFEGMLIPSPFVQRIGLPDERFFVFGEDTIYGYLADKDVGCVLVFDPLFEKLIPIPDPADYPALSNLYFSFRNRFLFWEYFKRDGTYKPFAAWFLLVVDVGKQMRTTFLRKNQKQKRLRFIWAGIKDGYHGNFGPGSFFQLK